MTMFGNTQPAGEEEKWRYQLDRFVKENQQELAALSWGLWLENGDTQGTIGIDIEPKPHFVYCPKEAVEKLNSNVNNQLQEILGLVNNYKPEQEVLMIGIGSSQVKLIYFEPQPSPPESFEQLGKDVDTLIELLEQRLTQAIK